MDDQLEGAPARKVVVDHDTAPVANISEGDAQQLLDVEVQIMAEVFAAGTAARAA